MTVVDASIVVRLLLNQDGDEPLRERFELERHVHAPALVDAEVTSALRGLMMASHPAVRISAARAEEAGDDYASLPIQRHPMLPLQRRALSLRNNFTAFGALYVALAEMLEMPLLTDDRKYERATGHNALIETWE